MAKYYQDKRRQQAIAAVFSNDTAARMAVGMLESHGIECGLADTVMSSIYPLGDVNPNFGVRLFVNEADLDRALQLLKEHGDI